MADFHVDVEDIRKFAADLRKVDDKSFRRAAHKRLLAVTPEGVAAAKAAALSIPTQARSGKSHRGADKQKLGPLRPLLAAAIAPSFRGSGRNIGVSIRVSRARLANRSGAEKVIEYGGRHKTFGHEPWEPQAASPWFRRSLEPFRQNALKAFKAVMDDIAREAGFR